MSRRLHRIDTTAFPHALAGFYGALRAEPLLLNEWEDLDTGADPVDLDVTVYQTKLTTGGTEGPELARIGNGTGVRIGQRKLVTLTTRTHASDSVALDHANIATADGTPTTSVVLAEEGAFLLLEWKATTWGVRYTNATVET